MALASKAVSRFPEMNYNKAGFRVSIMCTLQRMVSFIKNERQATFLVFVLAVAFGLAIVIDLSP